MVDHLEKYLELLLMVGRSKRAMFQHFKDRFHRCVDGWNMCYLS